MKAGLVGLPLEFLKEKALSWGTNALTKQPLLSQADLFNLFIEEHDNALPG